MDDKENPMEPINAVHRALKRFMRNHPSYDRGSLQDWLNLFWFITSNKDRTPYEKAKKFIQMAILTHKVIRYRDIFPEKAENKGIS